MRLNSMLFQSALQSVDGGIGKRRGLATGSSHNRKSSGDAQNASALGTLDVDEEITGKQGQIKGHFRPIAPLPVCAVKREIVLNLTLTQVLRNPLFVTARDIHSKPLRGAGHFCANRGNGSFCTNIFEYADSQGFAILTWVKCVFQEH
jgi:hypothetical protein